MKKCPAPLCHYQLEGYCAVAYFANGVQPEDCKAKSNAGLVEVYEDEFD